jgi:hypothetical protein
VNNLPRCVSPRCKVDPETRTLTPRYIQDGLRLCAICARILGEDVLILAVRHRQLGLVLAATSDPNAPRTSGGTRDANIKLNLRAAVLRRDIETTLHDLTGLIVDQRGFAWPADRTVTVAARPYGFIGPMPASVHYDRTFRVAALARFCARSAAWVAARDDAEQWAGDLRELATGESRAVAFPSGVRRFVLPGLSGEPFLACPERVDDGEPCPGYVWAIVRKDGDRLPSQIMCNHDDTHQWSSTQWVKFGRRMLRAAGVERAAA